MIDSSAQQTAPGDDKREPARYRLRMVNILEEPLLRTKYLTALEKFTPDPKVPYIRIYVTMFAAFLLIVICAWLIFGNMQRIPYIIVPIILFFIACTVLIVLYLISSRDKSMLAGIANFLLFQYIEKRRIHKNPNASLESVGIKEVTEEGILKFSNGDVGVLYEVVGHMSLSILPRHAEAITLARDRYLIARPETTQEILSTSISQTDLSTQIKSLKKVTEKYAGSSNLSNQWRAYMAGIICHHITEDIAKDETTIRQVQIIRDTDISALQKATTAFEGAVIGGMLSRVKMVKSRGEIFSYISNITLSSEGVASA
jgi:hypothetical protein